MLGIVTGFGALVTWVLAFVACGGALFVLPFRIAPRPVAEGESVGHRGSTRVMDFVVRRRREILVGAAAFTGLCFWYAIGMEVSTDPIKYLKRSVPVRVAHDVLERRCGHRDRSSWWSRPDAKAERSRIDFLKRVDALERALEKEEGVTTIISIVRTLKELNQALADGDHRAYALPPDGPSVSQQMLLYSLALPPGTDINDRITVREDALRITLVGNHDNSNEAEALVNRATTIANELGLTIFATGKYYLYQETSDYVVQSLLRRSGRRPVGRCDHDADAAIGAARHRGDVPQPVPLFAGGALLRLLGRPSTWAPSWWPASPGHLHRRHQPRPGQLQSRPS